MCVKYLVPASGRWHVPLRTKCSGCHIFSAHKQTIRQFDNARKEFWGEDWVSKERRGCQTTTLNVCVCTRTHGVDGGLVAVDDLLAALAALEVLDTQDAEKKGGKMKRLRNER